MFLTLDTDCTILRKIIGIAQVLKREVFSPLQNISLKQRTVNFMSFSAKNP